MDRRTILEPTGCDLRRLPLGAVEAFVLSRLDGRLTLEEIAEVAGIELNEAVQLATRLLKLGAVRSATPRPMVVKNAKPAARHIVVEEDARPARRDPRADALSLSPPRTESAGRISVKLPPKSERPARSSRKSLTPPGMKAAPANARPSTKARAVDALASRTSSKAMRAPSSARTKAATVPPKAPVVTEAVPRRPSKPAMMRTNSTERNRQLVTAMREVNAQARIDLLVRAAEDALKVNNTSVAANNYRLALQYRDDPILRMKLEDIDGKARTQRFDKQIGLALAAERAQRSAEAAAHFTKAHEAKPDAVSAERAAHHLRVSGGDLARAEALAESAIALDGRTAAQHITLGEICLAADRLGQAERAAARALELAPKDARARELAAAIAKRRKSK